MKRPVILPRKMSALIRIALADLAKVERSKVYQVAMGNWHETAPNGRCSVCFAGAVMAKTCSFKRGENVSPNKQSMGGNLDQFFALDSLRQGEVSLAASELHLPDVTGLDRAVTPYSLNRAVTPYSQDPARFRADMAKLADDLEEAGL